MGQLNIDNVPADLPRGYLSETTKSALLEKLVDINVPTTDSTNSTKISCLTKAGPFQPAAESSTQDISPAGPSTTASSGQTAAGNEGQAGGGNDIIRSPDNPYTEFNQPVPHPCTTATAGSLAGTETAVDLNPVESSLNQNQVDLGNPIDKLSPSTIFLAILNFPKVTDQSNIVEKKGNR